MDKRYFEYIKHNDSTNQHEYKNGGHKGVNISIQEIENKKNKLSRRPCYGTGNMSNILSLINDKKNTRKETNTFIEGNRQKSQNQQKCKSN